MSTTWVSIGLLAETEVATVHNFQNPEIKDADKIIFSYTLEAFISLGVSIIIAFGLPMLEQMISK